MIHSPLSVTLCRTLLILYWGHLLIMKKLLTSPSKMPLSEVEANIYQNILKLIPDVSLNLMAVKVSNHPEDFAGWCYELIDVVSKRINFDLLEPNQLPILKKIQQQLEAGIGISQIKTLRIAPWPVVFDSIQQNKERIVLDEQLALLKHIESIRETSLVDMIEEDKLAFAGKHTAKHDPSIYQFDVEWLASTKTAKALHNVIATSCTDLNEALNHIPLEGDITLENYMDFVRGYIAAFAAVDNEKATLAPATRLLAMRRPDFFTPVTAASLDILCQAFGLVRLNNQDFDRYWHDIVMAIHKQPWFIAATPEAEEEQALWQYKALVPCWFAYYSDDAKENSNYYKALHKPKRASSEKSGGRKRGKESAEALVDRALAAEDMPQHIKNMRDSIVKEVAAGRGVDETIALMRTIFG